MMKAMQSWYYPDSDQVRAPKLNIDFRIALLSIILSASDIDNSSISWDTNPVKAVLDSPTNCHIWTKKADFIPGSLVYFGEDNPYGVLRIGSTKCLPVAKGSVLLRWHDNKGTLHTGLLEEYLYFPSLPVNVISVSCFAVTLDDEEGTWIKTRRHRSTFA